MTRKTINNAALAVGSSLQMKNTKRSRGALKALNHYGTDTVGPQAMARQGRSAARRKKRGG